VCCFCLRKLSEQFSSFFGFAHNYILSNQYKDCPVLIMSIIRLHGFSSVLIAYVKCVVIS
jgi:hypothetical protein